MKKLKRYLVLLTAMVVMSIFLTSCGSMEKKLVGTWDVDTQGILNALHWGGYYDASLAGPWYDYPLKITFYADGTYTTSGEGYLSQRTGELMENPSGDERGEYKIVNDGEVLEFDGRYYCCFEIEEKHLKLRNDENSMIFHYYKG